MDQIKSKNNTPKSSELAFEAQLWAAADKMRGHIRGIDANLRPRNADSFRSALHPDLKADFILANPPFNTSDWGGANWNRAYTREVESRSWQYGQEPAQLQILGTRGPCAQGLRWPQPGLLLCRDGELFVTANH